MCIDRVLKVRLDKIARMFDSMRAKKTSWDKPAIFLSVWRQKKKNNQRTKLSIYILDTIESESTRFKNRSSDRMMRSDWKVDLSDDRYTTSCHQIIYTRKVIIMSFEIVSGSRSQKWLKRGHENLFKTRNNALNNIWVMIQKEYWCLIWNINM